MHIANNMENTMPKSLAERLAEINGKTLAWIAEDPENRGAGLLCDEPQFWFERGILNGDDLDHYLLVSDVFEMTRDACGYKPDWNRLDAMTNEELEKECDSLSACVAERYGEEVAYKKEMVKEANEAAHKKRCLMTHRTDFAPMGLLFP